LPAGFFVFGDFGDLAGVFFFAGAFAVDFVGFLPGFLPFALLLSLAFGALFLAS
jgi:hypothetical protein